MPVRTAIARNVPADGDEGGAPLRQDWELVLSKPVGPTRRSLAGPGHLRAPPPAPDSGVSAVVIMPIGFLSDHMEVLYDLDDEARQVRDEVGLTMVRAATVGTHSLFVQMLRS